MNIINTSSLKPRFSFVRGKESLVHTDCMSQHFRKIFRKTARSPPTRGLCTYIIMVGHLFQNEFLVIGEVGMRYGNAEHINFYRNPADPMTS